VSQTIPPSQAVGAADDPALAGVRALVMAAPRPMAVLDADGACILCNALFRLRRARPAGTIPGEEVESPLTLEGGRRFTLVTVADAGAASPPGTVLAAVANALPVMLSLKDRESRYLMMNRYQARLYGTTPERAVGKTPGDLLGGDYGTYARALDRQVLDSGKPMAFFEESYPAADGVVRRWLTSKAPVANAAGTIWAVATISADITDRVRLEEGLRLAKEEAEAANRARSGFLAAMSHELRTPLNAVNGFAEIMHQQALGPIGNPEYVDYAGHILRSGQHLLALINDVLDFARIESGSLVLNVKPIDLGAVLRATLDVLARRAEAAGVTLVRDLTEQVVILRADEQRLRQVMLNVAGNAVKFTPAGGRVAVSMRPDMRGGAIITVADSGIGIAEQNLPLLFEPFWQADSGLDRLREGTGIGLPLARQLIALHGGRLELESRPGEGTKVTVTLPERPDSAKRQ
jgi:PAS domain S-box-containing protein